MCCPFQETRDSTLKSHPSWVGETQIIDILLYKERIFPFFGKQHFLCKDLGFGVSSQTLNCPSWLPGHLSTVCEPWQVPLLALELPIVLLNIVGVSSPVHLIILS